MKANINYKDALSEFKLEINDIKDIMETQKGKIIRECAKVVKANVTKHLARSAVNTPGYTHMQDDVKATIKDDNQGGMVAIIGGGKETAYKWHLVNNGTSKTPATHFADNALSESEEQFNGIVDAVIMKEVSNGR